MDDKQKAKNKVLMIALCAGAFLAVIVGGQVMKHHGKSGGSVNLPMAEESYKRAPADNGRPAVRLLFLGDSDTGLNSMPEMIPWIAASAAGEKYSYQVVNAAQPPARLIDYAQKQELVEQIAKERYAGIILQDKTADLATPEGAQDSQTAIRVLALAAQSSGSVAMVTVPWSVPSDAETPEAQDQRLDAHIRMAGAKAGAPVVPVGYYWQIARSNRPALALLTEAKTPTIAGSYLTALVVYGAVSQNSPANAAWAPAGISAEDAAFLRQVAAQKSP